MPMLIQNIRHDRKLEKRTPFARLIMSVTTEQIKNLLRSTQRIINHQQEIEILKGEKFNVFSILGMESRENETHSAFLGELLNPNGSHLKGTLFLELFLATIDYNAEKSGFDIHSAKLKLEHHVGARNDKDKTGGRIDIYLWDGNGVSISIENKIYAGDQYQQIERYVNHNKDNNIVYYLTLDGSEASKESSGKLQTGSEYYPIAYSSEILEWLDNCIKEAAGEPILRESIKQYIILIKKLTHTMDNDNQKKLTELLLNNYESAKTIAEHFLQIRRTIGENLRQDLYKILQTELSDEYVINLGNTTAKTYSQIWIKPSGYENSHFYFGIESFSGIGHTTPGLYIGIINAKGQKNSFADLPSTYKHNRWWFNKHYFKDENEKAIDLNNSSILSDLHIKEGYKEQLLQLFSKEITAYLKKETPTLTKFLNGFENE